MRLRLARTTQPRRAAILVKFALLLPVLLGLVGLVIDSGLLMAAQRRAQNAADAAAMAAAVERHRGATEAEARTVGTAFVKEYNGLSAATVTLNFGTSISTQAAAQ